ncbi:MAG: hypothetical protein EXS36_08155 [Pedosphaera sp.]|nr:hypothetical protein [Pedosphaera sp.]
MKSRYLAALCLFIAGGVVGYVAGYRSERALNVAPEIKHAPFFSPALTGIDSNNCGANTLQPSADGLLGLSDLPGELRKLLRLGLNSRGDAIRELVARLPLTAFPGAWVLARGALDNPSFNLLDEALRKRWVREDLAAALGHAGSLPSHGGRANALRAVYTAWAGLEPAAALESAKARPQTDNRLALIRSVLQVLAQSDPERALREIRALKISRFDDLVRETLVSLARTDPVAAMQELAGWPLDKRFQALEGVLVEWIRNDADAAVAWCESRPSEFERKVSLAQASRAISATDPERAMKLALKLGTGDLTLDALSQAFQAWCGQDLIAAEQWLQAQPAGEIRRKSLAEFVRAAVTQDPALAARYLDSKASPEDRVEVGGFLAAQWGRLDPIAASAWVEGLPAGPARDRALSQLLNAEAETDPAGTIQKVLHLPASLQKNALGMVFRAWQERDPDAAIAWLEQQPMSTLSEAISQDTLESLAERDPRSAARLLLSLSSLDRQVGWIDNIVVRWAISDMPGAVEFASGLPDGTVKDKALRTVADWWSESDPKAALEFSVGLPDGEARRDILNNVVRIAASQGAQTAADWVQELPPGEGKDQALKSVAKEWSQQNPKAALTWIETLPAGEVRRDGLATAVGHWAEADPTAAANYATHLTDLGEQARTVEKVLGVIANSDPQRATAWLAEFPAGDLRTAATPLIASAWAQKDPEGAAAWLLTLPADNARFQALQPIVDKAAERAPQWAWQWASALTDPRERTEAITRAGGRWMKSNPSAARAAFATTEMPPEVRSLLDAAKP